MSTASPSPSEEENPKPDSVPKNDRDLNEFHGSVVREKNEPQAAARPLSVSMITLFCLIIFSAGLYLGTHSGGFKSDVFDADKINYGPSQNARNQTDPVAMGRRLFMANCSQCHQSTGLGVPNQYPPLAGSEIVQSQQNWGPNHVVMIVLNGLNGPVTVKGGTFNGDMPKHRDALKDEQIAFILTYIRQQWGNKASPINKEGVASIRAEIASRTQPWTEAELKAIPAKDLPGAEPPTEANPTDPKSPKAPNATEPKPATPPPIPTPAPAPKT